MQMKIRAPKPDRYRKSLEIATERLARLLVPELLQEKAEFQELVAEVDTTLQQRDQFKVTRKGNTLKRVPA